MRIATWNVNSLKARLEVVCGWLARVEPDVLLLQETKLADQAFPSAAFEALGYRSAHHGSGRWNGVALLSRIGLGEPRAGFFGRDPDPGGEARLLTARCGGVQISTVYVPNGREVASEHFVAKLAFLERLRDDLRRSLAAGEHVLIGGDFNIAPEDCDVYDPAALLGATHVTEEEREALRAIEALGLADLHRLAHPGTDRLFTWWDYRGGAFHRDQGMRIDLVLASSALAAGLVSAELDREARRGQGSDRPPSDHAPLVVELRFDASRREPYVPG